MTFQRAACAEMLWPDRPIAWQAQHLHEMGFGLGLWNWPGRDLAALQTTAVLGLVSAVNRPPLRINLDLCHRQIPEGDLIRWCKACGNGFTEESWSAKPAVHDMRAMKSRGEKITMLYVTKLAAQYGAEARSTKVDPSIHAVLNAFQSDLIERAVAEAATLSLAKGLPMRLADLL